MTRLHAAVRPRACALTLDARRMAGSLAAVAAVLAASSSTRGRRPAVKLVIEFPDGFPRERAAAVRELVCWLAGIEGGGRRLLDRRQFMSLSVRRQADG